MAGTTPVITLTEEVPLFIQISKQEFGLIWVRITRLTKSRFISCILGKETFSANNPFSHRRSTKRWLSKHQGPLSTTHFNWISKENLNWSSHTEHKMFFASLRLIGLSLKNRLSMLREHSSRISLRWLTCIAISSSSFSVSDILLSLSRKSGSMSTTPTGVV